MSGHVSAASPASFTSFGDLLKYLRRRAQITQRDLSIAVGYSEPQISYLEKNRRLPDVATVSARFVPALDLKDEPALANRLVELAQLARREADPAPGDPPFKGLHYFDEADANLFFGREELTKRLVARVISPMAAEPGEGIRFLAVVGASGSGKSSVLRAGLLPALRDYRKNADWQIQVITPTSHPLQSLGTPAQQASVLVVDQFEELFTLCSDEGERKAFVDELLAAAGSASPDPKSGNLCTSVVIALRADFYAECSQYPALREALAQHQEFIGPMNATELRSAIEEPAKVGHAADGGAWEFEAGLVDLMLRDTGEEPGSLPLLSHALLETWTRRRGHTLTVSGYLAAGGVQGAIAETAETLFNDELDDSQRAIARNIFLRLTELGEGSQAARRRASLDELTLRPEDGSQVEAVLNRLTDARLVTTDEGTVEIAHEALIREWPTLRQWLLEDQEGLLLQRQLAIAAHAWNSGGQSPDELYRGARLARAVEWAAAHVGELNVLERAFLDASRQQSEQEAAEREAQRRRELIAAVKLADAEKQRAEDSTRSAEKLRRRAYWLAGALVLVLALLGAAFFLGNQARTSAAAAQNSSALADANALKAESEKRIATSRELAAAANNNLTIDPERSILLAIQAVEATAEDKTVLPEAESALHAAVQTSRVQLNLLGHTGAVHSVAVNAAGTQAATRSEDGTARIWDLKTGKELLSLPTNFTENSWGTGAAFTPDGTQLLTVSDNNSAKLWDLKTGKVVEKLTGHTDFVGAVAISPDGKTFATASADMTAKLWDAATGKELFTLAGHEAGVDVIAFGPDGSRVYTGSDGDGTAKAWDTSTGKELFTFSGQGATIGVDSIAASPDGTLIATGEFDTNVKIWDAANGNLLRTLFGHASYIDGMAFSRDGKYLASSSEDGTARIWDPLTGRELLRLDGHTSGVLGVAFEPDGTRLVTVSRDGTGKVWDISPAGSREWLTLVGHDNLVNRVAYSPDGTRLATAGADGVVKVWDAASGKNLFTTEPNANPEGGSVSYSPDGTRLATVVEGNAKIIDAESGADILTIGPFVSAAAGIIYSPDGKRLAGANADGEIIIYDSSSGKVLVKVPAHKGRIEQVTFSPDGTSLASAGDDSTAKIWDTRSGKLLLTFDDKVRLSGIIFSPDGKRLASSSNDGTIKIWDSATGAVYFTLRSHTGATFGVAFSPDGKQLATTSVDRTVKVWTLPKDGEQVAEPLTLLGHKAAVYRAVFSPDGTRLATASRDGTSRVYALPIQDLIDIAKSRVTRALTNDECQKFLHVEQCPPPS